jgi:hypothetical protein
MALGRTLLEEKEVNVNKNKKGGNRKQFEDNERRKGSITVGEEKRRG